MHSEPLTPTESKANPSSMGTSLNFQRSCDRLSFTCPVMFAGVPFIGEGSVHNLSQTGCTVECDRTVLEGSYMKLRLLLPDRASSLCIELAAVRWVREHCFGVEFLRLSPDDGTRLADFLADRRR